MKKATVKYVQCKGEVAEGIIFDSITDIKLLSPSLKQAEVSVLRKFMKSGESPSRLNHIVSGFSPLEYCISSLAMAKSQFNKNDNPLYLLGESSEVYLAQIVALIMRYGCVFMNDKGGLCPMFDKDGGNYLEVLESEVITEYPKRSWLNYKIGENTKYIVLENDCELERKAIDYLETVDRWNYSYVKELIMFDEDNLKLAMEFIEVNAKFRQSVVSGSFDVPPVRVRWYGEHIDDIFDGTVIDSDDTYYFVIPDENIDMEIKWRKNECEVLR